MSADPKAETFLISIDKKVSIPKSNFKVVKIPTRADVSVDIQIENAPCFFFLRAAKYGEVTKYVVGGQENLCKGSYLKTISEGRLCSPKRMDVWEFS